MRKAKNRNNDHIADAGKKVQQICELCKKPDIALAGEMIRGHVVWICYNCYRRRKKR